MARRQIRFHQTTALMPENAIDADARELLGLMHQVGARPLAQSLAATALVVEIAGKQPVFRQRS